MTTAFAATKFHAPRIDPAAVERHAILARLQADGMPRMVLAYAPGGYGKSTVVRQWLARRDPGFSWIALDADDADPRDFWAAVALALADAMPTVAGSEALEGRDLRSERLVPLIDAVLDHPADHVLVLDGLHHIEDERTLASLDWWLARLPPNLCVVVLTRSAPPLPTLDELRARGELLDLSPTELRLSAEEVDALVRASADVGPADAQAIAAATEGWPAAVALVARGLRRGRPLEELLTVSPNERDPFAALVRTALAHHTPEDRARLLGLAVLARFDEPLATETLEDPAAWSTAMGLAEETGFLVGLDDTGDWWRLHHLVRDTLHAELGRVDPRRRRTLHQRAGAACEQRGDVLAAMDHHLAAEDYVAAVRLAGERFGRMPLVRQSLGDMWLQRFPRAVRESDAFLCFWAGWSAAHAGDRARRDEAIAAGRRLGHQGPVGAHRSWESAESFLIAAGCFDDVGAALEASARVLELEPAGSVPAYTVGHRRASLLYLAGRYDEAAALLDELLDDPRAAAPPSALPRAYRALVAMELGDTAAAGALIEQALGYRPDLALDISLLVIDEAHGRWQTQTGDPAAALTTLESALRLAADGSDGMLVVPRLYGEVARAHRELGDQGAAEVATARALALLGAARDPGDLIDRFGPRATSAPELSQRELEVLQLLPGPLSAAQIASELFVSPNTLRTHIKRIHRKLGASTRADAVAVARSAGLLSPD